MPEFMYERAESLQHALSLLQSRKKAYLFAGGTNLLLKIRHGQLKPNLLVGVGHLTDWQYIRVDADRILRLGAGTKINDLLKSVLVKQHAPLLHRAAREIGSPEVKNMATVGGNICSAAANCGACGLPGCKTLSGSGSVLPCRYAAFADLILPLMAMEAKLLLCSPEGEKTLPLKKFLDGLKITGTGESILLEIFFPIKESVTSGYARLATGKTMGITVLAAAASVQKNSAGTCSRLSLALGGASLQKPVAVTGIDQFVNDETIDETVVDRVIAAVIPQLPYQDNLQYSLHYLMERSKTLIRNAIMEAVGM